jgi:steroid delta-isomerase-like uncharacterized protein
MDRNDMLATVEDSLAGWNTHDAARAVGPLAGRLIDSAVPGQTFEAGAPAEQYVQQYFDAFPDLTIRVDHQHVTGDSVIQEWTATGTHEGELQGIAPTHRTIETHGCAVAQFNDEGKIEEFHQYWNPLEMITQLTGDTA